MDFSDFEDYQLIDVILEYSELHPNFDNTFVCDVEHDLHIKGRVTDVQREELENIILKFKIIKKNV